MTTKSKQRVSVEKVREVITYAEMWHTSLSLLTRGQEQVRGSAHQFRASLVFTAFTLEAYLNHVGAKLFACWDDLERLGPREKLNLIAERLEVPTNYAARPWQVMKELFSFRNAIAHGKSRTFKAPTEVVSVDHEEPIEKWIARTEWEQFGTEKNTVKARADVEKIVNIIYESAKTYGCDIGYPFAKGGQSGSKLLIR
jgi:hypothetical protein